MKGSEGSRSLILANAMYLSSWQKKMIVLPNCPEEEVAFEAVYEEELKKK